MDQREGTTLPSKWNIALVQKGNFPLNFCVRVMGVWEVSCEMTAKIVN